MISQIIEILATPDGADADEAATVHENTIISSNNFEEWKFLLLTNHSLLFWGVGSKQILLHRFVTEHLDGDICEIDGYDNVLTIESILDLLSDQWLGCIGFEGVGQGTSTKNNNARYHVHFDKANRVFLFTSEISRGKLKKRG